MNPRGEECCLVVERRQDTRQALGQHRLAHTRWPDQQQVVAASRTDLKGAPSAGLPADVGKVGNGLVECRGPTIHLLRLLLPLENANGVLQR